MPAPRVRGDYNNLQTIARSFGREASQTGQSLRRLKQQVSVLRGGDWLGKGATAFYAEMDGSVLPALNRLENALQQANRVTINISQIIQQAENDAAAVFRLTGSGGAAPGSGGEAASGSPAAPAPSSGGAPSPTDDLNRRFPRPNNMGELYQLIEGKSPTKDDGLHRNNPVQVIQTGPNDYMVLVRGTDPGSNNATFNFGGALDSGAAGYSDYTRQVKEYIAQNVPPGANISMVGHSQGGITINNIADDQAFRGQYNVQNVVTFGAPNAPYQQPGTNYYSVQHPNDLVTFLDRSVLTNGEGPNWSGIVRGVGDIAGQYVTTGNIDNIAHLSYENSAAGQPLPPGLMGDQWSPVNGQPFNWSPPQHGMAAVWHQATQGSTSGWGTAVNMVGESAKLGIAMVVNSGVDTVMQQWGSPTLRNAVDGYRDRLLDNMLNTPPLTQTISQWWPFN